MSVLVDPLTDYAHRPMGHREWCHLATDASFEELHDFAARLGIPRRAFQGDHYDLTRSSRERAIALGAEVVSTREMIRRMLRSPHRRWRER
ncbi:MAG TPA: DUF4031 domain-containing protein [Fimbriimonas sp.]